MTREQLEHAIRAACDVAGDTELLIFGSQAILGQFPEVPAALRASIEVDLQPKNRPEAADLIDAMLGEYSQFHSTHGFYVHGLLLEATKVLEGWQARAIPVTDPQRTRVLCLLADHFDVGTKKFLPALIRFYLGEAVRDRRLGVGSGASPGTTSLSRGPSCGSRCAPTRTSSIASIAWRASSTAYRAAASCAVPFSPPRKTCSTGARRGGRRV